MCVPLSQQCKLRIMARFSTMLVHLLQLLAFIPVNSRSQAARIEPRNSERQILVSIDYP